MERESETFMPALQPNEKLVILQIRLQLQLAIVTSMPLLNGLNRAPLQLLQQGMNTTGVWMWVFVLMCEHEPLDPNDSK